MPLPDAPPTDQSRVYREFASKTALPGATGAITADLIDNFKNSLFLDEFSEDELRRLLLLQMVTGTGSVSGPMPNTSQIIAFDQDTASSYYTVFTPGVGEVWQFIGASVGGISGLSGTITHEIDLYNSSTTDRLLLIDYGATSSSDYPIFETNTQNPTFVGYPLSMRVRSEGTFTNIAYNFGFVRVR